MLIPETGRAHKIRYLRFYLHKKEGKETFLFFFFFFLLVCGYPLPPVLLCACVYNSHILPIFNNIQ